MHIVLLYGEGGCTSSSPTEESIQNKGGVIYMTDMFGVQGIKWKINTKRDSYVHVQAKGQWVRIQIVNAVWIPKKQLMEYLKDAR